MASRWCARPSATPCWTPFAGAVATLAGRAGVGAEPAGAAALAGLDGAVDGGLVDPLETIVLLVTGREVKAAATPTDHDRVAVVERLEEVERALAGDLAGVPGAGS
jgi:threonine synthase